MEASAMAVRKRLIYQVSGGGLGDEDWYFLAFDKGSARTYVIHDWSRRDGESYLPGSEDVELQVFLAEEGPAQARLRDLIGTLVEETG